MLPSNIGNLIVSEGNFNNKVGDDFVVPTILILGYIGIRNYINKDAIHEWDSGKNKIDKE